jgi:hypothetical protein
MTEADIGPEAGISLLAGSLSPLSPANTPIGDRQYILWSAQYQEWRGESDFVDISGPIFSMYMEMAEEEDKKMAKSWKADVEGILVFVRLYLLVPVYSLLPSHHLSRRRLRPFNRTHRIPLTSTLQISIKFLPPKLIRNFEFPPCLLTPILSTHVCRLGQFTLILEPGYQYYLRSAVATSQVVFATLLQQWAQRYLQVTQTRSSLHKRARTRLIFAVGVEKSHLSMVVEALPPLIHVSLSLFFAGLVVFLWNVNLTIFKLVLSWISICVFYGCITFIPIFVRDSPYYSPLTPLAQPIVVVILFVLKVICAFFCLLVFLFSLCFHCHGSVSIFGQLFDLVIKLSDMIQLTPEEAALKSPSEIDTRAFT